MSNNVVQRAPVHRRGLARRSGLTARVTGLSRLAVSPHPHRPNRADKSPPHPAACSSPRPNPRLRDGGQSGIEGAGAFRRPLRQAGLRQPQVPGSLRRCAGAGRCPSRRGRTSRPALKRTIELTLRPPSVNSYATNSREGVHLTDSDAGPTPPSLGRTRSNLQRHRLLELPSAFPKGAAFPTPKPAPSLSRD
jgi:hypothetical protein